MPSIPHFDLPFRFDRGRAAVVEQDTLDDVGNCVEAIMRYERGSRPEATSFGLPDQTFREGGVNMGEVLTAITESEERAGVILDHASDQLAQAQSLEDGIDAVRITVSQLQRQGAL